MTAPITFPHITPPQFQSNTGGSELADLGQLLIHVAQGREQLALERQRVALEKKRTEASVKASNTADAASAAEIENKKRELEQRDIAAQAGDLAAAAIVSAATAPGGLAANAENVRISTLQKAPAKLREAVSKSFSAQLLGWQQSQEAIAQRRTAETTAKVGEETAGANIAAAKSRAELTGTEAKRAKVNLALDELRRMNDPQRAAVFLDALAKHVPVGAAREVAGIPAPFKTLSDSYMLADPATNEGQRKAEASASGMAFGNALIKSAYAADPHLRVSTLGAFMRTNGLATILASPFVSDGQKQLVQGFQMMGAHYALHITGTQSANAETVRLMNTIADQPGDSDAMLARRSFVRDVVVAQGNAAASGKVTPVEAMAQVVATAKRFRLDPKTIGVFQQMQNDAQHFMGSNAYKVQRDGATTPADASSIRDPVLKGIFQTRP